jgi:CrcB protein
MSTLSNCFIVGLGGAVGTIFRYLLGLIPLRPGNGFPLTTLCINVIGAFCIGLIVLLVNKYKNFDPQFILFIKVGFCGGFTTFSAFSLESVELLNSGNYMLAILYIVLSVVLCLSAVFGVQLL